MQTDTKWELTEGVTARATVGVNQDSEKMTPQFVQHAASLTPRREALPKH